MKIKNLKLKIILFILISLILNLKSPTVAKAQSVDLGVYPPIFEIQTTPPSDVKVPFFIENFQDQTVDLKLFLKPFTADSSSENGQVSFIDDTSSYPDPYLLQRVSVLDNDTPIDHLILAPKEKKDLVLEIEIPGNEPKGEYYFSLVFSSEIKGAQSSNTSQASGAIASNILLSIGPLGKTEGFIQDFSSPFFVNKGPVPFNVRIKNTSDHYITAKGNITIKNMFGQTIGKVDLLPSNILSNTIRRIPDSLQSGVNDKGFNKIKEVVEKNQFPVAVWPEKFLLGAYTANLTVSLSDQGPVFKRQITFFAFPFEYIIGLITVIAIVVFIVLRVRKKVNH